LGAFARSRIRGPALLAALASAALLWLPAAASADTRPSFTYGPVIQGAAVVGSTLKVAATSAGVPTPTVKYRWGRCPASNTTCQTIAGATDVQHAVTPDDVGYRLAAEVTLTNKAGTVIVATAPTGVVVTPPPPPAPPPPPPPPPDPAPAPPPPLAPTTPVFASAPSATRALPPTLMRPFPVVRIRGYFAPTGARITLLSVRGPRRARISARCVGPGCPVSTLSVASAPARLRPFERFLRAGTLVQIRVARPGRIGKYASFLIRAGRPPLRTDRCLRPGRSRPMKCPAS
jgi:hypothetical protein